jgi:hypothetical protein
VVSGTGTGKQTTDSVVVQAKANRSNRERERTRIMRVDKKDKGRKVQKRQIILFCVLHPSLSTPQPCSRMIAQQIVCTSIVFTHVTTQLPKAFNYIMSLAFQLVSKAGVRRMGPGAFMMLRSQVLIKPSFTFPVLQSSSSTPIRYFTEGKTDEQEKEDNFVYEGPFSSLALRLKRLSICSAAASVVGVPLLITFGSNIPASGQIAVGGTAILAACGSTAALSFCFSPYIHKLEWIPVRQCNPPTSADCDGDDESVEKEISETKCQKMLMKVTTRNFLAMQTETIFDPDTDVIHNPKTYRPFCNFLVKDKPYFIHPELLHDDDLRIKLLGKEKGTLMEESSKDDGKKKDPDDDFL